MAEGEQPKIIVDDDWKSQAQAEKEKLAEQSKAEENAQPEGGMPDRIGFTDLVRMFASQALMYMGAIPDPQTGKAVVALDIAKLNIDLLGILEDKTKGNLTETEKTELETVTRELRSQFVELGRMIQQAQAEGRIGPDGSMQPPSTGGIGGGPDLGIS